MIGSEVKVDNPIVILWNTVEFGLYLSTLLDHVV